MTPTDAVRRRRDGEARATLGVPNGRRWAAKGPGEAGRTPRDRDRAIRDISGGARATMRLDHLRTFIAVVEHGTFTRAAEALGVSQSTVSSQIGALESDSGTKLLDRGGGSVEVTPAGAVLQRYAARIVSLVDEAAERVVDAETTPRGRVAVSASTIVAEYLLPPLLRSYRTAFPEVGLTIEVSDSRAAVEALATDRCELALVGSASGDRRFESDPFAHDQIVLVGPPDGMTGLAGSAEIARLPLVLRERGSGTRSAVASLLAEARLDRPDVLTVGSTEAARRSVLAGLGYSFISRLAVDDDVRDGRLRVVALPGTPVERSFHVVRRRGKTPSAAAGAFVDHVLRRR